MRERDLIGGVVENCFSCTHFYKKTKECAMNESGISSPATEKECFDINPWIAKECYEKQKELQKRSKD